VSDENPSLRYWKLFALVSQLTLGGIGLGSILSYFAYYRWGVHWSLSLVLFFLPVILSFREIYRRSRSMTINSHKHQ
jgi:hypothetical protein